MPHAFTKPAYPLTTPIPVNRLQDADARFGEVGLRGSMTEIGTLLPSVPVSKRHRERQFYDPATLGMLYYATT